MSWVQYNPDNIYFDRYGEMIPGITLCRYLHHPAAILALTVWYLVFFFKRRQFSDFVHVVKDIVRL